MGGGTLGTKVCTFITLVSLIDDEVMSNIQPTKTQPVLTDPDWLE